MKIVFMGTPQYAVVTLDALIKAGNEVCAVFAQPDKPVGRKRVLTPPPTKVYAEEHSIVVYQPITLRDGEAQKIIEDIAPAAIVVVAYGKILPKEILSIPKYGCINGHASLLPKYRGASPIQWSIISGETYTGVSTMYMDEGMDTGDILETAKVKIGDEETADELFERLSLVSAELMVSTIQKLENGSVVPKKQDENEATYAPILKKEMAKLDFNKSAAALHNEIRGYYSWPCSFFVLGGKRVKVLKALVGGKTNAAAATVARNDEELVVACGDGTELRILKVQPEGGKPMTAKQMLCGKKIPLGTVIKE